MRRQPRAGLWPGKLLLAKAGCGRSCAEVFALAMLLLFAGPKLLPAAETQQWDELKLVGQLTSHVDIFAATTLRLATVNPVLNRVSGQVGLNLRPVTWLTLSPNYQSISNDPATDTGAYEHRPGIVSAIGIPIRSTKVILSAGLEYRVREGQPNSWRLRPKVTVQHPLGPSSWKLTGYLANELFFESDEVGLARNRFYAGIQKTLGENWSANFYYCRQHDPRSSDPNLNIIGISMTLDFDLRRNLGVVGDNPLTGKNGGLE